VLQAQLAERDPTWLTEIHQRYEEDVDILLRSSDPALVGCIESGLLQSFRDIYGGKSYFCRYHACASSVTGFDSSETRDRHEVGHVPKFKCEALGCFMADHGFKKQRDLKLHGQKYHPPPKAPNLTLAVSESQAEAKSRTPLTPAQMAFMDKQEIHRTITENLQPHPNWSPAVNTWGQLKQWLQRYPIATLPVSRIEEVQEIQFGHLMKSRIAQRAASQQTDMQETNQFALPTIEIDTAPVSRPSSLDPGDNRSGKEAQPPYMNPQLDTSSDYGLGAFSLQNQPGPGDSLYISPRLMLNQNFGLGRDIMLNPPQSSNIFERAIDMRQPYQIGQADQFSPPTIQIDPAPVSRENSFWQDDDPFRPFREDELFPRTSRLFSTTWTASTNTVTRSQWYQDRSKLLSTS
jgi:hypothetical protein